jgi:lipid-binding SYLF domain-containing protein
MKLKAALAALALIVSFTGPGAADSLDEQELVSKARYSVERLIKDPDVGANVRSLMKRAKAALIFPNVLKGAFIFGAEGGSGVLLARDANGVWSYPAFYTMGSASFGLQIGGSAQEILLVVMTDRALDAVLHNEIKLGADASIAAGPDGVGVEASTTTNLRADIYSYSVNQGLFVGASVEGAVIHPRESKNHAYYSNNQATPEGIVLRGQFRNPQADRLRQTLYQLR